MVSSFLATSASVVHVESGVQVQSSSHCGSKTPELQKYSHSIGSGDCSGGTGQSSVRRHLQRSAKDKKLAPLL